PSKGSRKFPAAESCRCAGLLEKKCGRRRNRRPPSLRLTIRCHPRRNECRRSRRCHPPSARRFQFGLSAAASPCPQNGGGSSISSRPPGPTSGCLAPCPCRQRKAFCSQPRNKFH